MGLKYFSELNWYWANKNITLKKQLVELEENPRFLHNEAATETTEPQPWTLLPYGIFALFADL